MQQPVQIFWFRRDLRLHDNHALFQALNSGIPVVPIFIFDTNILDQLSDRSDRRVSFIYESLVGIQSELRKNGSTLDVRYGEPLDIFTELATNYKIQSVFTNHDYEPYATERDSAIQQFLAKRGIGFLTFKDQVIFEKYEVVKDNGEPYSIFTPFSRKWRSMLNEAQLNGFPSEKKSASFFRQPALQLPSLDSMGFTSNPDYPKFSIPLEIIAQYDKTRDIPSIAGTSRLGVHLRFGTVSVRQLVAIALKSNATYLGELIWREFFMQLLWQQPRLVREACKPAYDKIKWRNNEEEFQLWCEGRTGFPIVDAGMRELNATGFMHNRVRMIAASFLVKHLLIDWRWGEAYFAEKLLDFELSSNNGNWQWISGSGCDSAPYFRIFNPHEQTRRFDNSQKYIQQWVPEFDSEAYAEPVVEHKAARERCLRVYKEALHSSR